MTYALAILAAIGAVIAVWWLLGGRIKRRVSIPDGWHTGPIIDGRNYSHCDFAVTPAGWKARLGPGGELDAGLKPVERLPDVLAVKYRVTGELKPVEGKTPALALFFQRAGDNWSAAGAYHWYRWYSRTLFPLTPGVHTIHLPMKPEHWTGVYSHPKPHEDRWFHEALAEPFLMGFGFGASGGRMHGITGTGTIEMTGD